MRKTAVLPLVVFFSCAFLCMCSWCRAQQTERSFTHLSVENGLSQSSVYAITQDSTGFMWFGTRNCLNRYDTRSFKIYRHIPGDSSSISSSDYIFTLLRDKKNRLWVGTQRGLNLYLPDRDAFERILHDTAQPGSISDNYINCIYEDRAGSIWVGTNNGLNRLTGDGPCRFLSFHEAGAGGTGLATAEVHAICQDKEGAIWIGTTGGLTKMTMLDGNPVFTSWSHHPGDPGSISCNSVTSIAEDRKGYLWVATECGGLNVFDGKTGSFLHYTHNGGLAGNISSDNIRKIIVDEKDNLWIGTIDGLNYFNTTEKTFTIFRNAPENPQSLSNNSIRELYEDKYGSLWVGTVFGGVNVSHAVASPFTVYKTSSFVNSISSNVVSAITADERNNLWIGTEAEGVNYFDRTNKVFIHYKHDPAKPGSLSGNFVKSIYRDKGNNIWIGTYDGGLNLFHPSTRQFTHYRNDPANAHSLPGDNISCILEDSYHRSWVGAYGKGLNLFYREKDSFQTFTADPSSPFRISSNWVRLVYEDNQKNLWVGTAHGLNLLPAHGHRFTWFLKGNDKKDSLVSDYINCMMEDRAGDLWIGTYDGGLSQYHRNTQKFTTYTMQDGLPGNNVRGILEDDQGLLWLSTDNGLCKFDPGSKTVVTYNVYDGLPGNEFNYNSYYRDSAGQLFFGGYAGLVSFYPGQIRKNLFIPPIVFTGLKLFNRPVGIQDKNDLLNKDISLTRSISFSYRQNIFTLEFAALNYIKSGKNRYAYKLDGFESDWNYVDNPSATYTNLPSGHYTFLVRGTNNDGLWNANPARMQIIVLPPLWKTWWAYLAYIVIIGNLLFLVIRFFRRQARLERDLYYEQQQIDFFTNISHEIRTPLTLIVGPIDKLLQHTAGDSFVSRQLGLAKKNADRLVRLVTELLDFRKAVSGNMQLWVSRSNMVLFAREVFSSFEELAVNQSITYHFEAAEESIMVSFDPAQMEKVLLNLLSNAFKFTGNKGAITLSVQRAEGLGHNGEDWVQLRVTNTGKGIPPEVQSRLFERFYQATASDAKIPGSGIGLALSKSIVELHQGRIRVESRPETDAHTGNTSFTILLPPGPAVVDQPEMTQSLPIAGEQAAKEESTGDAAQKPTILLVEDNPEIRLLIRDSLSGLYHIVESANGAEGWETAIGVIPDLVISDVMMEGVDDGFMFCQRIKQDEKTSHIPVILLTARVAAVHQISGLRTGADAYITKPFHIQVLELQVRNLLSLRNIIRAKFTRQITLQPPQEAIYSSEGLPAIPSVGELFLEKLVAIVEEGMEDPGFGVPILLKKVGMSQTVLYRKLKALTDMSIADFIKSVRLKRAALLLRNERSLTRDGRANPGRGGGVDGRPLSVADVAYMVGFSDRKYFSKEFRRQFGQSPTEYQFTSASNPGNREID